MIYSEELNPRDFQQPVLVESLSNIEFHNNDYGFGTDLILKDNSHFRATAYPDRTSAHLLVALERIPESEAVSFSENQDFIYWFNYQSDPDNFELPFTDLDNTFLQLRNGQSFDVIVLDPGHGGRDPGAVNRQLRIYEKDIALAVARKVGEYINQYMPEVEVVYTRDDDRFIELEERGRIAAKAGGDLFISIHANSVANNTRAYGAEVYFLGLARTQSALEAMKRENSVIEFEEGGRSIELTEEELLIYELANAGNLAISEQVASLIEDQFRTRAQRRSRGVKQAGFMVLWNLPMPAVLIELGFLSNPNEARYMASEYGQTILASAIFRAIRDFKLENDSRAKQTASSNE
ncbi:MAG: N-acetylmuramoyl-L-alanine amidase [Balneolaceae bacterium]|nr:MAG: N-acetylmuramoyl-L-alanine amidase [Balneolaceae bacterium]